jgi:hypothetical protein
MQSIPFDPALVLGNIVDDKILTSILEISKAAAPADAAQEALNALITSKRSIDMTIDELTGMGIDAKDVVAASKTLGEDISKAAVVYAQATIKSQQDIIKAKGARASVPVSTSVESPIDYNRSQIKQMPLSANSLKLDAQYFSNDENDQNSSSVATTVKGYVSETTSFLGDSNSEEAADAAQAQTASQYQKHDVAGTLVISAGCTHKDAVLLAPLVIDPDKAIRAWNATFPDDQISTDHPEKLVSSVMNAKDPGKNELKIISGATYGSSFVGMVHVLKSESTNSSQSMYSVADSMQATMKAGGWFSDIEGGFGVADTFSNDVKSLLSVQKITSHCSIITMGLIPSIKSSAVKIGVQQFAGFDAKSMGDQLAALQNATASDSDSVSASAANARTGGQMMSIQASKISSVMSSLKDLDESDNNILDINSVMTAFEDFVTQASQGNVGVPINYYVKHIPKAALAHLWVSKYYPQYLSISEDDSGRGGPAPAANAAPAAAPAAS